MPEISYIFIYGGLLHYFYIKTDVVLVVPVEKSKKKLQLLCACVELLFFFFHGKFQKLSGLLKN